MGEVNWANRTLWTADNLKVMRGMNSGTVDLIYLDPPFNSKKDYAAPIGSQAAGAAFQDTWSLDDVKREWAEDIQADNTATWSAITVAGFTNGDSAQAYLTYMAIRLIEMRRILKPTGSIYLHCDPTMSHYLKLAMDAIFGARKFRRELIWNLQTTSGYKSQAVGYIRGHDTLLYYTNSSNFSFNKQYLPHKQEYIARFKKIDDAGRQYRDDRSGGRRQYLDQTKGVQLTDVWSDIMSFQQAATAAEITGYPTQKPLALLERIIKASSNPGELVLDPFCGCATTCVAAERLGRQWAGIDIEEQARELVVSRLQMQADDGALLNGDKLPDIHHLKRPPRRTDPDTPRRSKNIKQRLYERQQGRCAGQCGDDKQGRRLDLDLFEVDHIIPRAKGGADVDDNLQLLCPTCNRIKGSRTMSYLLGRTADKHLR